VRNLGLLIVVLACSFSIVIASEWRQEVTLEYRQFSEKGSQGQVSNDSSLLWEANYRQDWNEGRDILVVAPRARLSNRDSERNLFDFQSLSWSHIGEGWELRSGVRTETWQVVESAHLIDILNQIDATSDVDGEDKLGQPMLNLVWYQDWGSIEIYALPGFRERMLPGDDGRLRLPLPYDTESADYESGAENLRTDAAVRFSAQLGEWELALTHFSGTSREPLFNFVSGKLRPFYPVIDQSGLELQYAAGDWLWKFEGATRSGFGGRYSSAAGGFEYTYSGITYGGHDLGVLIEYLFDDRGQRATLNNDVFIALRWSLNDLDGTELLAGVITDADSGEYLAVAEYSQRFGSVWRVSADLRWFDGPSQLADQQLGFLFDEDYVSIELTRFF
jgi:hypothetical protein